MKTMSPKEATDSIARSEVEGERKRTTIRFDDADLLSDGKKRAKELGTSLSNYVSSLVCIDIKKDVLLKTFLDELSLYYTQKTHPMSAVSETMCMDPETIYEIMAERIGFRYVDTPRENIALIQQKLEELENNSH